MKTVGRAVPGVTATQKATGEAKFGADILFRGILHAKVLRSPHAHANIVSIDTRAAEGLRGVLAVITHAETPGIPCGAVVEDEQVLAAQKVRYVGDEIAAVAAIDEETALQALDLIHVEYEVLRPVLSLDEAMAEGAPLVHQECPGNVAAYYDEEFGDIDAGFRDADVVLEEEFRTQNVHQAPLEPTGCVANVDASGRLTLWIAAMDIFHIRTQLALALGMPEGRINIIRPHCGGSFGAKVTMKPVYPIAAMLALKTGRPVRLFNSREEEFMAGRPRGISRIRLKAGIRRDGSITAREAHILVDSGAYANSSPYLIMALGTRGNSLYRVENIRVEAKSVYTNKTPMGAYRGFGSPESHFAFESMVDMLAREIGMDPLDVRLKNAALPNTTSAQGWKINSCGLRECLRRVGEEMGSPPAQHGTARRRGVGFSCQIHPSDMRYWKDFMGSVVFVKILEDGSVVVNTGENEYGQGSDTIQAQIVAEVLGVPIDRVLFQEVSTDLSPYSIGPFASRTTISAGTAAKRAAEHAREQLLKLAAEMRGCSAEDMELRDGQIALKRTPGAVMTIAEVARAAQYRPGGSAVVGKGVDERDTDYVYVTPLPGREQPRPVPCHVGYGNPSSAYFFSAEGVEVDVDTATGEVQVLRLVQAHDCGRPINPLAAEGQSSGGIVQGLGWTLLEEIERDTRGRVLNANFLDFRIPTFMDTPPSRSLRSIFVESNEPLGPFGAKGLGEAPQNCSAGAIANAIFDAVGVRVTALPITPEKVLKAIARKRTHT